MDKKLILNNLIKELIKETDYNVEMPNTYEDKKKLYRVLVNIRNPKDNEALFKLEDEYLTLELKDKKIINIDDLKEVDKNIYLYQGDITLIKSDAIVNAGNSLGLGCFTPNHLCVDNAIHTFSGMRLRLECNNILNGSKLNVSDVIICNGYNLPCKYVITTVGPRVIRTITESDENKLYNCYMNSLILAKEKKLESICFSSISTGIYGYPINKAKYVALKAVKDFLKDNDIKVIFNLFSKEDYEEYERLFKN